MPPRYAAGSPPAVASLECLAARDLPFDQWLREAQSANGASTTEHEALGIQIRRYYESTRPSRSVELAREGLVERLQEIIHARWPAAGLQFSLFGSSFTNMHTASSDLDLVILDPARTAGNDAPGSRPLPEWFDVRMLARQLRAHASAEGFTDIRAIPAASVPIVTFRIVGVPRLHGVKVDIAVNNRFGTANGDLINAYADIRPGLVRPLCLTVKRWLKLRGLNEPAPQEATQQRSLCSYTIVLLVIAYLQATQRLPNLQDEELLGRMWIRPRWLWGPADAAQLSADDFFNQDDDGHDSLYDTDDESIRRDERAYFRLEQDSAKYNVTFFHPFSEITRKCSIRKIQDPGHLAWMRTFYYRKRRIPPILSDWLHHYEAVRSAKTSFKGLPTPGGVALHQKTSANAREADAELGSCLTGFIDWFLKQWKPKGQGNPCFDIASSTPRLINTLRQVELWEAWNLSSHRYPEDAPPLDSSQGADWPRQRLVVADPFLKQRNTARNIKVGVAHDLYREFIRAQQILKSASGAKVEKLFQKIDDERPYIVDGGAEQLSRLMRNATVSASPVASAGRRGRVLARGGSDPSRDGGERGGVDGGGNAPGPPPIGTSAPRGRGGWSGRGGRGKRPG